MSSIQIIFYDGVISKPREAQLSALDDQLVIVEYFDQQQKVVQRLSYDDMALIGAVGRNFPVVELKNEARIELLQQDLPDWFKLQNKDIQHRVWKLERTPSLIVMSLIFMLGFGFAVVKWGIPMTANYVAEQLPSQTLKQLGDEAEKQIINITEKSTLAQGQQDSIRQQYLAHIAEDQPAKLIFRKGEYLGANAMALPNHTIIMTDELVEMAHSDQEILGVLAHEQGHLIERHSLKSALAAVGMSVIYVGITGDSSDLFATLPVTMVNANYSRQFETDADAYAMNVMQREGMSVSHFANMLERIGGDEEESTTNSMWDFFSSHPSTAERVAKVRAFDARHTAVQEKAAKN